MSKNVPEENPQPVRSPVAGCFILIAIVIVPLFVVSFAAYSFKKQTEGFASFSEEEEVHAPITPITDAGPITQKLTTFEEAILAQQETHISLNKEELNLAIAHFPELEHLRGLLFITEISNGTLKAQYHRPFASTKNLPEILCRTLNIEPRDHFLHAEITATPLLSDGQLFLKIKTLIPSRGEVPEQLIQGISPHLMAPDSTEHLRIQKALSALTSISIESNTVVFRHSPGITPPSGQAESEKLAGKARHLVALGALIFLLTVILFLLILAKRKRFRK